MVYLVIVVVVAIIAVIVWFVHHQRLLRRRAELIHEAVCNHDFTFRLPTTGLFFGERAMQEALNQMGNIVRAQVSQKEVEAWERMTRVLTHEIMNATAPIASISQAMLGHEDIKGTSLEEGVKAIHTTSTHLISFVDSYRKLSQWQKPMPEEVRLADVTNDIIQLYPEIDWQIDIPYDSIAYTDSGMLHQILMNLVKNAKEANAKRMGLKAERVPDSSLPSGNVVQLLVSNDGHPIPPQERSSVFIPFFTTKREGSGIGLSLSRRMITMQGGNLELADRPCASYHTTFILSL
jgi:signal transduction histidine kinase